ncbi:MAG: hypothetical protein RLZZ367_717 [Bacteroidota bacterium]|jgi:hypothetical protein
MGLLTEKKLLHKEIDEITDVEVIKAIKQLLQYAKLSRESSALQPFTKEELVKRAKISERDIKSGRTISLSEARKQAQKW